MAIIQGNAKQGSVRGFYPKVINGSLRFNDDDSAYLSWTPASASNRKTWTWSGWVKKGVGGFETVFRANLTANNYEAIQFTSGDQLRLFGHPDNTNINCTTNAVLRDPSAWYHFVFAVDTTQATASNRVKIYVNGTLQSLSTATYPSQNLDLNVNNTTIHHLSGEGSFDGYLANVHFIDGQALTPSDFGETKNGVWVAKDYAGTFGTNGFYLTFEDDTAVEAFNTVLYRGTQAKQSITGYGFSPDLVWIKNRSSAVNHYLVDQVRGATKALFSNSTAAEDTDPLSLQSFDSDGFTLGSSYGFNANGDSYVAWGWKAGGAPTVDNSAGAGNVPTAGSVKIDGVNSTSTLAGSIPATRLSASTTYGFSIVSYTGNGSNNSTVAHGLSSTPDLVLVTARNFPTATNWAVFHSSLTSVQTYLRLNTTDPEVTTDNSNFGTTEPTSSVMNLGYAGSTNTNNINYIMYCWSETTGYSKFGSYTGNGSTSGPTVTCGFKPAWLMVKRSDGGAETWAIHDNTRSVNNPTEAELWANLSNAEQTSGTPVDLLSNGFQVKNTAGQWNTSGATYIYAAFADTREAAFWLDQSGNDNDWQPVNLDHNDTVADSPTNNFATWNPLNKGSAITLKDGNLSFTQSATWNGVTGTVGVSSGQWYFEYTYGGGTGGVVGVAKPTYNPSTEPGIADTVWRYRADDGTKRNGGASSSAYGATWTTGDVIGVAYDLDAGTLEFYKNGVSQGVAFTNLAGETVVPVAGTYSSSSASYVNFGQQPFKYDPPA